MYPSKYNYVSEVERDGQRLIMNFLSRSADILDSQSALHILEGGDALTSSEKEYLTVRGYLVDTPEEAGLLEGLPREAPPDAETLVVHLDTFTPGNYNRLSELVETHMRGDKGGTLIFYGERPIKYTVPVDLPPFISRKWGISIITIPENLIPLKPLIDAGIGSTVTIILGISKAHNPKQLLAESENILDALIERGTRVEIIARLEEGDVGKLKPLVNYFISKGWPFLENFKCTIEPVPNDGCIFGYWYNESELPRNVFREYRINPQTEFCTFERWMGVKSLSSLIWTGKLPGPSLYFCMASKGLSVLTGRGKTYSCLRMAEEGGSYTEFHGGGLFTLKKCRECGYAPLCGGGCSYQITKGKGCPPIRELIEMAIEHYFDEFLERLKFYDKYHGE